MRITVLMTLTVGAAFGLWGPDVRLTIDSADSQIYRSNSWNVAAVGDTIHVTWFDYRDGNSEIYYKRSTNGGADWEADTRLTYDSAWSGRCGIAATGSAVHVIWSDRRTPGGGSDPYYKRSTDGGTTWGDDVRLGFDGSSNVNPCIAVHGDTVHVAFGSWIDLDMEIFYRRSTDRGATWDSIVRLSNALGNSWEASVAADSNAVHVVWYDLRDDNYEIYYRGSTDGGSTWGAETRLTNDASGSSQPSIAASGSMVHMVWKDSRDGNGELYYKRSTDGGLTWGSDTRLTYDTANMRSPSVAACDTVVHVVYNGDLGGDHVRYIRSTNAGDSWGTDTQVTSDTGSKVAPTIAVNGNVLHVVWEDERHGEGEIYHKRNTDWTVAVGEPAVPGPTRRPTGATVCRSAIMVPGGRSAVLLDITGRRAATLLPGQNDIRHVLPGVYFVRGEGPAWKVLVLR